MNDKAKGEERLPRLAPVARRVVLDNRPKTLIGRLYCRLFPLPAGDGAQTQSYVKGRRRGLAIFPVLELVGIAMLIFLLAK